MTHRRSVQEALRGFGMDTITLAGPLEAKLEAMQQAGFGQVMLKANDLVGHPQGWKAAVHAVRRSGLRGTGFQVLRDFEGLSGHLHDYKVDIAKTMLEMCAELGCDVLLACSSTSIHASQDPDQMARDLHKLSMLAVPFGIRIAYEGLSWGRSVSEYTTAWDVVCRADSPNLGLCIDSFHILAAKTPLDALADIDPDKIYLVQLSDFLWQEARTMEERIATARTYRVFPGEGVHTDPIIEMVLILERMGYRGDYSFEVFNDDFVQMPLPMVAQRACNSALWLADDVLRRSMPLPNQLKLRSVHSAP